MGPMYIEIPYMILKIFLEKILKFKKTKPKIWWLGFSNAEALGNTEYAFIITVLYIDPRPSRQSRDAPV